MAGRAQGGAHRRTHLQQGLQQCGMVAGEELGALQRLLQPGILARARRRASRANTQGSRSPAIRWAMMSRPDTPSRSASTPDSLIPAHSSSFSRCFSRLRSSIRSRRYRVCSGTPRTPGWPRERTGPRPARSSAPATGNRSCLAQAAQAGSAVPTAIFTRYSAGRPAPMTLSHSCGEGILLMMRYGHGHVPRVRL